MLWIIIIPFGIIQIHNEDLVEIIICCSSPLKHIGNNKVEDISLTPHQKKLRVLRFADSNECLLSSVQFNSTSCSIYDPPERTLVLLALVQINEMLATHFTAA